MQAVAPPASRNARCPCGSGRRYKECHGVLRAADPIRPAGDANEQRLLGEKPASARMFAALEAQKSGRMDVAVALYESVIAAEPENFDALHMLGVAYYQMGILDTALKLVSSALQLRPDVEFARHNLALIRSAIGHLPACGEELCGLALPRLARYIESPGATRSALRDSSILHLVRACDPADPNCAGLLAGVIEYLGRSPERIWVDREGRSCGSAMPEAQRIDVGRGAIPRNGAIVVAGLGMSFTRWWANADIVALAIPAEAANSNCLLIRCIRALANDGTRKIHLLCGRGERAHGPRLPLTWIG
ncbi:MAG: SEC-C domain-containing protein [Betaproteobacteria bacterium]|nr:SEC-C domain-containing protein [Betaproteobacteria bacterium]MDE2208620.1 SEC-C domain-containing protein [Betaproteobacteria bacterium]MDE2359624.1 SEC-C domain-containing protein [Betaproteobacteria bacterium]